MVSHSPNCSKKGEEDRIWFHSLIAVSEKDRSVWIATMSLSYWNPSIYFGVSLDWCVHIKEKVSSNPSEWF